MTMSATPLISVVTVCLNARDHIAEALDSMLDQSFESFEIVVVDGGSADGTMDVVRERELASGGRLRWVSEPDEGLYDAMNKGLAMARGEFIEYLGADDRLAPGALEAVAVAVGSDATVQIVSGSAHIIGPHGGWDEPASELIRRGMPQRAPARHQSIFVRTETLRSVGGFDTRYRIAADYDAYLKLYLAGARQVRIADMLSEYRLGGASSRDALATARDYRDIRIAHGANPVIEGVVMYKAAFGAWLHALGMRARAAVRRMDV